MGWHPLALQQLEQPCRDLAVQSTFVVQLGFLLGVESRGVVLELHQHPVGIRARDTRFALPSYSSSP